MPFCVPATTMSRPQASVSIGTAPRLETASIASRHVRPRESSAMRWMSETVAVEVSECTTTASVSDSSAMASATAAGSGGRPQTPSNFTTSAPKASAIAIQRLPNAPVVTQSTRSPASTVFANTDSNAPVPEAVKSSTSCSVR